MKHLIISLTLALALASCTTTKDLICFQDRQPGKVEPSVIPNSVPFKLQPGDRISISISSRNPQLTSQFNMGAYGNNYGGVNNYGGSSYLVSDKGEIDFPVLGKVPVVGMDRQELTDSLTDVLRSSHLVDDAIVKVEYTGLYVYILGQGGGRRVNIDRDRMSFFELLATTGDLSADAERDNILVIRDEYGQRSQYELDVRKMKNVYESPVYYVHQNDIIYLSPNAKARFNTSVSGTILQTTGFWSTISGTVLSVIGFINAVK